MIPVSWGDLFDRITIPEIKSRRIGDAAKLANMNRELAELNAAAEQCGKLDGEVGGLIDRLRGINLRLRDIEDDIRLRGRTRSSTGGSSSWRARSASPTTSARDRRGRSTSLRDRASSGRSSARSMTEPAR